MTHDLDNKLEDQTRCDFNQIGHWRDMGVRGLRARAKITFLGQNARRCLMRR